MLELNVELGERSYPIYIDSGLLNDTFWHKAIKGSRVLIVTNDVVAPLYLNGVKDQLHNFEVDAFILKDGEAQKSFENFEKINTHLLEQRHGRDTTLVALGGGVVGDLTGFVAACYQRGVNFIQLPTTLLSQVDSSVGGKTAINHPLGKNMIGAFYQPQSVVIDIDTLKTLPPREFAAGMAEVIKYGIIYDGDFFSWLEQNQSDLVGQKSEALSYVIHRCCQIKAEIVAQDEKEAGLRALLNLGHTFGHAIEAEMGFGQWLHGEAVAAGIVLASQVAVNKNWLDATDFRRIVTLLQAFSLPVEAPDSMSVDVFWNHMAIDKKVKAGKVRFVIPTAIGKSELTDNVSKQEVAHILAN